MNSYFNLSDFITSFSFASKAVNDSLAGHNLRVAYLSYLIGVAITFDNRFLYDLLLSGLLHDIGLFYDKQGYMFVEEHFPSLRSETRKLVQIHAEIGYEILRGYPYLSKIAKVVRYHHSPYFQALKEKVLLESQIVYFADRIDVYLKDALCSPSELLKKRESLPEFIEAAAEKALNPKVAEIFLKRVYSKDSFWFTYSDQEYLQREISFLMENFSQKVPIEYSRDLSQIFAYLIDFKSPFTASHSSTVAVVAKEIAREMGYSEEGVEKMEIAGLLHDIGKVKVPDEILNKPGKLTREEFFIMKSHVFYTYQILKEMRVDEEVLSWASLHHEKLNGRGYPFGLTKERIPLGSRIMTVADIYTALTEERPYKKALKPREAVSLLRELVSKGEVDGFVLSALEKCLDRIERERSLVVEEAKETYSKFLGKV